MLEATRNLREYFDSDVTLSVDWRKQQLKALIRMLKNERDLFEQALFEDLGKNAREAYLTEIGFVIHEAKYALSHLSSWMRMGLRRTPLFLLPSLSAVTAQPRGIALIISPWNYPLQLTLSPLIASIAAGNVTLIKPSENSPATSALLAKKLMAYLDPKAISVHEGGADVTQSLLREPIDFVFFTGGTGIAKHVAKTAAENLVPYVLELGGKSPTIVFDVKNIQAVADRIIFAKFTNTGQTCVAPDYVLVEQALLEPFVEAFKTSLARQFPKPTSVGHIINSRHFDRLTALLGHGENIVTGGQSDAATLHIEPTIVTLSDPDHPLMQEEIFGPILPILTLNSNDPRVEAREFVKRHPTPLACYVFCDKKSDAKYLHDHVLSGNFVHNDALMHVSNVYIPFGGVGMSGQGGSHGYAGFQAFSHMKGSLWNTNKFDMKLRYPPYSFKTFKLMEWFLS